MNYKKIIKPQSLALIINAIITRLKWGYIRQFSLLINKITFFVMLLLSCKLLFAQSTQVIKGKMVDKADLKTQNLTDYVNTFIGKQGIGQTLTGANTPSGFVQLIPKTSNYDLQYCEGFQYKNMIIKGFSYTNLSLYTIYLLQINMPKLLIRC